MTNEVALSRLAPGKALKHFGGGREGFKAPGHADFGRPRLRGFEGLSEGGFIQRFQLQAQTSVRTEF
jgi:hypothetical protein